MRFLWFPFLRRDPEAVVMAGGPWGCWLCQGLASHLWQHVGAAGGLWSQQPRHGKASAT